MDSLINEYENWLDANGYIPMSADELLLENPDMPQHHVAWLLDFIGRWDGVPTSEAA
jgi:hypothetical protein